MPNEVILRFAGDSKQLDKTIKDVGAGADHLSRRVDRSADAINRWGSLNVFNQVGQQVFQFGKTSIAAFAESEASAARLEDAFARFPGLADTNINALQRLNTELAKKTRFDDDATASGQAVLAQFKLTGTQIAQLTPLLQDYAAKTGRDLPTAADVLGKALLGKGKALKDVGINFQDAGSVAANFDQIMKGLSTQVGGFATKEGKTAAGQAAILSNQFGELQEQAGEKLLPALLKLAEVGLKVVDFIDRNQKVVVPLAAGIGILAIGIWGVTAAQTAWNVALSLNPIGLIILAIAALVAIIVIVATKTRFFQTIWEGVWSFLKAVGGWFAGPFAGFFVDAWNLIVGKFNQARALIGAVIDRLKSDFARVKDFITAPFRAAFNFVADAWNNTIGRLRWTVPSWVPGVGGNSFSAPRLPHFHSGGVVPGAPGSEMIAVLQAGERVIPAGGGGAPTSRITVMFGGATDGAFATAFMRLVREGHIEFA